jgi:glucose/arabinose dehydrogenase
VILPDGGILITERPGRLRIVRNGVLDPKPIAGLPQIQAQRLSGLMDLALHPRFNDNKLVYFTYHKPAGDNTAKGGTTPGSSRLLAGDGMGPRSPTSATSSLPFKAVTLRGLYSAKTACCT